MKFSALTFAIAAAASASSVSAFGATRSSAFVATNKAGVSKRTQMNASKALESIPGSSPTVLRNGSAKKKNNDLETELETGIDRETHENRNDKNELPVGKLTITPEDKMIYVDGAGRKWKRYPDHQAAYHQPIPVAIAYLRAVCSNVLMGVGKVPNLKFTSKNEDGRTYSEVCCNRYTGELIVDQKLLGTLNFVSNNDSKKGHVRTDVVPHSEYGWDYKHVAKGIPIDSVFEPIVILDEKTIKELE
jgi:hypothetical protein